MELATLAWRLYLAGVAVTAIFSAIFAIELNRAPTGRPLDVELFSRTSPGIFLIGLSLLIGMFANPPKRQPQHGEDANRSLMDVTRIAWILFWLGITLIVVGIATIAVFQTFGLSGLYKAVAAGVVIAVLGLLLKLITYNPKKKQSTLGAMSVALDGHD